MNSTAAGSSAYVLVTLLIKLGVIASLASIIARFEKFRRLLLVEIRTPKQKLLFAAFVGVPFMLGVLTRLVANYRGADLSLEVTVIGGLLGGTMVGLVVGMMVSLPAVLIRHELLAAPMAVLYAVVAGSARWLCPNKEEVWKFSPFIDLSLYRSIKQRFKQPSMDWQILFFLVCVFLELSRIEVGRISNGNLFFVNPTGTWTEILVLFATAIAVALPLRIWNNTRIEQKLEEKERSLIQARMDSLISQINPHFLFNTLNTVSSLIRLDPDTARKVLVKLSNILRRRLKTQTHFAPLRQELDFIADYLDIEVVRFGRDKLKVTEEIDPAALDVIVPTMILQPLVENAIRHGIGPKIEGGTITLRAKLRNGRISIEVSDDGVGIPKSKLPEIYASGIGIMNVQERLKVLYGHDFSMKVESEPGKGTTVRLELPEVVAAEEMVSVETAQVEP
ncbi:MAG TPA: histidine kinase [Terriglobia bacterium]|jgi:two-component system LytT family sensor kinase|nr:histidine kinase [Terriglobia bacterium]